MKQKKKHRFQLKDVLSGDIFTKDFFRNQYRLLILIAVLFVLYINNGFRGQGQVNEINRLQNKIVEAKTILSALSQEYTLQTRPSYLNEQLQKSGSKIKESTTPVIVIE